MYFFLGKLVHENMKIGCATEYSALNPATKCCVSLEESRTDVLLIESKRGSWAPLALSHTAVVSLYFCITARISVLQSVFLSVFQYSTVVQSVLQSHSHRLERGAG